jgi:hypothetical protein
MCSDSMAVQSLASTIQSYKRAVTSFQVANAAEPSSRARDIFVNNEVRLDSIDVVGFDLDFTLAGYDSNCCTRGLAAAVPFNRS